MTRALVESKFFTKLFDLFIPLATWFLITLPLWLSPFHPALVSYFIISFDLYFFYKAVQTVYYAVLAYKTILIHKKISYVKKLISYKKYKNIEHFIIIPNYKEPLDKIASTISSIVARDYPGDNFNLVLAFEAREEEAYEKSKKLTERFKDNFKEIISTFHILVEGEVAGKASNQTYAAREVDKFVEIKGLTPDEVLITICDADSHMPRNFFSYMTYEYLRDRDRLYHFYWAPVLLYNNFWQVPFFIRMQATMSSILRLSILPQRDKLIQQSTYSTSLWLLKKIDFWDVDIIPEDWHVYLQAFFKWGARVRTIPLYTIVNGDAVHSGHTFKTFKNRYEQEKRWAWGVSDIGYALRNCFTTPHIAPSVKFKKIFFIMETHLLWPTSFFILTLSGFIPALVNPIFKRTVLGFLLPKLASFILTLSSLTLILYIYMDIKLRQRVASKTHPKNLPLLFIQWYLLPVVSFILSSLPALEAHTRIIMGKKLQYKVTEKV